MNWTCPPFTPETTRFLNVDLDIRSSFPLDPLVEAFGRRVCVLHVGKEGRVHTARLELTTGSDSPERTIRRFVELVNELPRAKRLLWNRARAREFNVGVQAAARPYSFEFRLGPETLLAVARVKARIGVTVYGAEG